MNIFTETSAPHACFYLSHTGTPLFVRSPAASHAITPFPSLAPSRFSRAGRPRANIPLPPLPLVRHRLSISSFPPGLVAGRVALSGWFQDPAGRPAATVRVRLGRRQITCTPCAQTNAPLDAPLSGFSAEFRVGFGLKLIRVEARAADGRTHLLARRLLFSWRRPSSPKQTDYALWRAEDARLNPPAPAPSEGPLISVLMPVHDTPAKWLRRAIESVRAQTYPNWQLCIADDCSTEPHVPTILHDYAAADSRIRVIRLAAPGHISRATNAALPLAQGEFVAFLDHDDELSPHALSEIARVVVARPDTALLYSDEDKIDHRNRHSSPYFKPAWNPDLLRGQNYFCHLAAYRTSLLRSLGGLRIGFEGAQDWDLALRATERLSPHQIVHIPRVLYHWRAIPGSTAIDSRQKPYAAAAAARALREHLERTGTRGDVESVAGGHWRVRRALPPSPPRVSLLIPTRNRVDLLRMCVESLLARTDYPDFEVIVIDNGSDEEAALRYLAALPSLDPRVRVLRDDGPFNYSALNNRAAAHADGEILGLLNNDLEVVSPDWLREMVSHTVRPEVGAVGARLLYPDGSVQHAGVVLGIAGPRLVEGVAGHAFKKSPRHEPGQSNRLRLVQNYSAVTAACLLVRRDTYLRVGGLDAQSLPVAFNDVDLCLRLRETGLWNVWTPFATLLHHESATRGSDSDDPEKTARAERERRHMRARWGPLLDHDPAYNPNLTLVSEDFTPAWPPRPARSAR